MALEVLLEAPDAVVVALDPVLLTLFRGPSPQRLGQIAALTRKRYGKHPTGIGSLVVLDRSRAPLSEAHTDSTAKVFHRELFEVGTFIRGTAVVLEHTGLAAASFKLMITAVRMLGRLPYPLELFQEFDPAARWLLGILLGKEDPAPQLAELRAALRSLRPEAGS